MIANDPPPDGKVGFHRYFRPPRPCPSLIGHCESNGVGTPEGVGVDERSGEGSVEGRQPKHLERGLRDAWRWAPETERAGWLESEPGVVHRIALEEDRGFGALDGDRVQGVGDQHGPDALTLSLGPHADRTQDEDVDESAPGVQDRPSEHDVGADVGVLFGDERQRRYPSPRGAEFVEEQSDRFVAAEGRYL